MPKIVIKSGEFKNRSYSLVEQAITVGRSSDNVMQVIDKKISRRHARFYPKGGQFYVADLDSKNGTYVNGLQIEEHELEDGDVITIGETYLIFRDEPVSSASHGVASQVELVDEEEWGRLKSSMHVGPPTFLDIDPDESRAEELSSVHKKIMMLYRASEVLASAVDMDTLLEKMMDVIFEMARPERGFILLREDDAENSLVVKHMRIREDKNADAHVTISSTIINRCLKNKIAMFISDAMEDAMLSASESIILQNIRSAISVPLVSSDKILGVVYIDSSSPQNRFSDELLEIVTGICNQGSLAIDNILMHSKLLEQNLSEKEMDIAREIQINFLPKAPPLSANFDLSVMSVPAKKVGGDYYDYIPLYDNKLGILIADVAGKGIPAALLVSIVRSAFRMEARREHTSVDKLMYNANNAVCRDTVNNMFITVFYMVLDVDTGQLMYSNAGHCHPLLFRKNGEVERLEEGGSIFGMFENSLYKDGRKTLSDGDVIVLYTDGVTDNKNVKKELYGVGRLEQVVRQNIDKRAEEIKKAVYEDVKLYAKNGELFDDFTLMIMKSRFGHVDQPV